VATTVSSTRRPDLAVGLTTTRDGHQRRAADSAGILAGVAEVTATIDNRGDAAADETITQFWVRGVDMDRALRVVHAPVLLPEDQIEVTALRSRPACGHDWREHMAPDPYLPALPP